MVDFYDRWHQLHQAVLSRADWMGVPPEMVVKGDWQKDVTIAPPGVAIYMEPGDLYFSDSRIDTMATVTTFCIAGMPEMPEGSNTDDIAVISQSTAIAMAWEVVAAYRALGIYLRWPRNYVQLDTALADFSAAVVKCVVAYNIDR